MKRLSLIAICGAIGLAVLILSLRVASFFQESAAEPAPGRATPAVVVEVGHPPTVAPSRSGPGGIREHKNEHEPRTPHDPPPEPGPVRQGSTEAAADPGREEVEVHVQDPRSPTPETAPATVAVEPRNEEQAPDRATPEPDDSLDDEPRRRDLSGRVIDEAGTPVAGLQVLATARRLVPVGQEVAVVAGDRQQSTRSDADGHFTFQGLLDGEYQVHTESNDQYGEATALVRAGVDSAVLVVTEKTNRSVHLHGLVESVREGPVQGVHVLPVGQASHSAHTDEWGEYGLHLPLDSRRRSRMLRFIHDRYREQSLTVNDADLRGVEELELNVVLEPVEDQVVVTGRVIGTDSFPIHQARIQLYSANVGRRLDAVSDREGLFSFPNVEISSDYRLWVRPQQGDYKDYVEGDLVIPVGGLDLTILLEYLEFASLRGQMVDPDGQPVPGFSLWLHSAHHSGQRRSVTGDQQGRFVVDRLPEGRLTLQTLASPHFTFSGVELTPGATKEIRLTLDTGRYELDGYLLNAEGSPLPGARVSLVWTLDRDGLRSRSTRETVSDGEGYFLFTQLGSGPHILSISANGFFSVRREALVSMDSEAIVLRLQELAP